MSTKSKKDDIVKIDPDSVFAPNLTKDVIHVRNGIEATSDLYYKNPSYIIGNSVESFKPDCGHIIDANATPFDVTQMSGSPIKITGTMDAITGEIWKPHSGTNLLQAMIDEQQNSEFGLSNIHEPISEHDKQIKEIQSTVLELQLNDERKDIIIQELREKLEKKPRKTRKRKSVSKKAKMQAEVNEIKKKVVKYEHEWRFTKDMHAEEAQDLSEE